MKFTRLSVAERNYLKGVMKAFLERKKRASKSYVLGCFRNVPLNIFDEIVKELTPAEGNSRQSELDEIRREISEYLDTRTDRTQWSPWAVARS